MIPDASAASLRDFITTYIGAGATVISDDWRAYPPALASYGHQPVSVSATGRPAHEVLPAVHRLFALVKRMLDGTYQGSSTSEHLPGYLDEFVFRFNRRNSRHRGLVFLRLMQQAVATSGITYRQLVKVPAAKRISPSGVHGPRSQPGSLDSLQSRRPWRDRDQHVGT